MVVAPGAALRRWLAVLARRALPCTTLEAETLDAAVARCMAPPALLLLGLDGAGASLPRRDLDLLRRRWPATGLALVADRLRQRLLQDVLAAGHCSYLLATQPEDELCLLLAQAAAGEPAHAPQVWQLLLQRLRDPPPAPAALTPRERDVLRAVGSGLSNAQAARHLGLQPTTVASYVKQVYRKLGISNRAQAARMAMRLGLDRPTTPP